MRRVCTSICLAAGVTTSAAVFADQQTVPVNGTPNPGIRDVTVTGCVVTGSEPSKYVIDVIEDRNDPAAPSGVAIAPGTPLRLVGLPPEDFQDYVGQQVEVFGMLMPRGSSHGRGDEQRRSDDGNANRKVKLGVRYIRQLSPTCPLPASPAVAMVPAKDNDIAANHSRGRGRRGRDEAARTPAVAPSVPSGTAQNAMAPSATTPHATGTTTGARPVSNTSATPGFIGTAPTTTAPNATGTTAGVRPVSNTSTTPGSIGTAPSNSTTSNAGLGQSGISGSATLGGAFSMTPPQLIIPIGGSASGGRPSPVPGSTPAAAPGSTQPAAAGSTFPGDPTTPGFAQGASNSTTTNAALDQFGLSGDALLSGLVNVNVQQLLASVQVQANLNVQDVIVNLSDILNDNQIQALVQALNTNPQAALNANDLSSALQSSGLLDPSQWVVGVTGSQIYANRSLTDALQSRGIIQPSETIMGTANPHVFVVGPSGGGQ